MVGVLVQSLGCVTPSALRFVIHQNPDLFCICLSSIPVKATSVPGSKKPLTDFLRQITTIREGRENDAIPYPRSKQPLMDFLRPCKNVN